MSDADVSLASMSLVDSPAAAAFGGLVPSSTKLPRSTIVSAAPSAPMATIMMVTLLVSTRRTRPRPRGASERSSGDRRGCGTRPERRVEGRLRVP